METKNLTLGNKEQGTKNNRNQKPGENYST